MKKVEDTTFHEFHGNTVCCHRNTRAVFVNFHFFITYYHCTQKWESFVLIRDFCTFHCLKDNSQWLLTASLKGKFSLINEVRSRHNEKNILYVRDKMKVVKSIKLTVTMR